LVDCWEGAALRSRLRRDPGSLDAMLDFYFGSMSNQARKVEMTRGSAG
jgi:TetR/AcrR family transcriptional repressor of nem operon